jgi:hypothetical protein
MDKQKHNGWSNYATWRVALEWFDDNEWLEDYLTDETYDLSVILKDHVSEAIEIQEECVWYQQAGITSCVNSYAHAFLSDVNWYEIAQHIKESVEA